MILPTGAPRPSPKALRMGAEVFHALKKALQEAATATPSATRAASRPT